MKKNPKLQFFGTDFTPLQSPTGDNNFLFKQSGLSAKLSERLSEEKQREILIEFLTKAQSEIDNIIVDGSLTEEEKRIYDYQNQQICFAGLVGVISVKDYSIPDCKGKVDISLQINSRLDAANSRSPGRVSPFFLMELLFHDYHSTNNKVNLGDEEFTDRILLNLFVEKYKEAFAKGFFKTYHKFEKNDDRIKGTIDIARHIRENMGLNNGRIAYSYKEKGANNYLNHLIVTAYEQLKTKYRALSEIVFNKNNSLKDSLTNLEYIVGYPKYTKRTVVSKNLNVLSHPFYTEYEDLRRICIKILREEKQSLFDGNGTQRVEGILVYIPRLWEKYIERKLHRNTVTAQKEMRIIDINNNHEYEQLTIPDFVFYHEEKPFMILDAKFKPGWLEASLKGRLKGDLLADYDKCIRDMVSIDGHVTGVIFPTNKGLTYTDHGYLYNDQEYMYQHNISKYNSKDSFFTFPVYVPSEEKDFDEWKKVFDSTNLKMFETIKDIILNGKLPDTLAEER